MLMIDGKYSLASHAVMVELQSGFVDQFDTFGDRIQKTCQHFSYLNFRYGYVSKKPKCKKFPHTMRTMDFGDP